MLHIGFKRALRAGPVLSQTQQRNEFSQLSYPNFDMEICMEIRNGLTQNMTR